MRLDTVLTAVNDNPMYIGFVPYFIRMWKLLYPTVDIKVVVVAEHIPVHLKEYDNHLILFKPIKGVSTAFTSQYVRLLYPCLLRCKGGILITDMDIVPMNRTYFTESVSNIDDTKFVYYRENICREYNQIAMCYNIALPSTWKEIFDIHTIDDVRQRLVTVNSKIRYDETHGGNGWCADQIDLLKHVQEWNNKTNHFISLKECDTKFRRLDRGQFSNNPVKLCTMVQSGIFSDYHCLRPYDKYKTENERIYDALCKNNTHPI